MTNTPAPSTLMVSSTSSALGVVLVAHSAKGIRAVLLGDDPRALRRELERRFPRATLADGDAKSIELVERVSRLIDTPEHDELPLDIEGTAFQRRVWQALREIPVGSTVTYTEIACRLGVPKAVRAVAQACAANPLAVLVPCHRVVRRDGGLAGYRWGLERKRLLLAREEISESPPASP